MIDGLYKSDILTSVSRDSPCHDVNRRFYAVVTPSTAPSSATPLSRCLVLSLWSCDGVLMLWCTQPTKHQLERCSLFWCPNAPKMDINTVQRSLTCNPATLHVSFWVVTLPLKTCDRGINLQRKFILFRQILSKSFWLIGEDQDWVGAVQCRYFEQGTKWMWSHTSVPNSVSVLCEELESPTETLS